MTAREENLVSVLICFVTAFLVQSTGGLGINSASDTSVNAMKHNIADNVIFFHSLEKQKLGTGFTQYPTLDTVTMRK